MPERRISELDFYAYRWHQAPIERNGKFGALPFFWHPSQASRLTIEVEIMLRR
jgi:hypothetical protein